MSRVAFQGFENLGQLHLGVYTCGFALPIDDTQLWVGVFILWKVVSDLPKFLAAS